MEELKRQVQQIITARFPDAEIELEEVPLAEKLSGHVVTAAFSGLPQRERSKILWKELREHLDSAQQQLLSAILTLSPAEYRTLLAYR
jgi:hypothetical protein